LITLDGDFNGLRGVLMRKDTFGLLE